MEGRWRILKAETILEAKIIKDFSFRTFVCTVSEGTFIRHKSIYMVLELSIKVLFLKADRTFLVHSTPRVMKAK